MTDATAPAAPRRRFSPVMLLSFAGMFLPFVSFAVGEWLLAVWAPARAIDAAVRPYAFSASLLLGLAVGLAQIGWTYARTRLFNLFSAQQLGFLLAFTFVPLLLGKTFLGYSTFGWVNVGIAAAYVLDYALGSKAFLAFPKRFAPHVAPVLETNPYARRVFRHLHVAFVVTWLLQGAFVLFAKQALPAGLYLLALPLYSKVVWLSFMGLCFTYPRIAKKRGEARRAAAEAASAVVPQAPTEAPVSP